MDVESKRDRMQTDELMVAGHKVNVYQHHSLVVGSGAAGMNCAVHLYEFMKQDGVVSAQNKIAVITRGVLLGASRMSGSDKQTYYKVGTSAGIADSAEEFTKSLTAGGCCHEDLALIEGITSLNEFYHLARSGVEFPHNDMGSYVGYKTDHDPCERATSVGPKTSKQMSECLQREVENYGIEIHDRQEVVELLTTGVGDEKRIVGVACIDIATVRGSSYELNLFLCDNLVLAAGGPGDMYSSTVYPAGQVGIHGAALKAGLVAENLSESQFGLASVKFRWNVSGSYMQVVPRIFSTDQAGNDKQDFLTDKFPDIQKLTSAIFLKGYQWPFDAQRIDNFQSSLIDMLVFAETQKGRRVYLDFLHNPFGYDTSKAKFIDGLEDEAAAYLKSAGAVQDRPIDRLTHMNPLAVEIYAEHGIDLWTAPLEIAVCAQHNNGGFGINKWWESNIAHTFIVGEMAGSHGVKRPGGAALNAGQVGGLRAAEYIANVYGEDKVGCERFSVEVKQQVDDLVAKLDIFVGADTGLDAKVVLREIRERMSAACGHIRKLEVVRSALDDAIKLCDQIRDGGLRTGGNSMGLISAIHAEYMALASLGYLRSICDLLEQGGGSRGSYLVLEDKDASGVKPENIALRDSVVRVWYDPDNKGLFNSDTMLVRKVDREDRAFESIWSDYRTKKIFHST